MIIITFLIQSALIFEQKIIEKSKKCEFWLTFRVYLN